MDGGQILLSCIKVWVVLLFLSTAFRKSKVAAESIEQVQKRELASENTGSISIDCGVNEDYFDTETGITYESDKDFISTGNITVVAPEYISIDPFFGSMWSSLRFFPEGNKNCYTLKPRQGRNQNYYIIAFFYYGKYDFRNQNQRFDLYLGVNYWATVTSKDREWYIYETTHYSVTDTINVCLINKGFGVPFITGLYLRFLDDSPYRSTSGSLHSEKKVDVGGYRIQGHSYVRYKDDEFDRTWWPSNLSDSVSISIPTNIDIQGSDDPYRLPFELLRTAARPLNGLNSLSYNYTSPYYENSTAEYLVYFHFAEIEQIPQGKVREFTITLNDLKYGPFTLEYLKPLTIRSNESRVQEQVRFSVDATPRSDLPPILNAFEIFRIRPLLDSPTNQTDVDAIMAIKIAYKIDKVDWQGDPCLPFTVWTGLKCNSDNPPRIISLDLSSSQLSGMIAPSLLNLTAVQSLDLSNNELIGTIPEAFAQLPNLTNLYLKGNKLTGVVPHTLKKKYDSGELQLSLDGNLDLCLMDTCEKKQRSIHVRVIASVISISMLLLFSFIAIFWRLKRGRSNVSLSSPGSKFRKQMSLKSKNHPFTYTEIVSITNNFQTIIGGGGFGKVYLGKLKDGNQVAVKLLSQSSRQGYKEFLAEVQQLMKVHHKNLVPLIGYCNEDGNMALVYEYMAKGNLTEHLLESSTNMLNWRERLQISVDAAQGLEYLHNGCRPPIVHRDLKSSNILLTENFQAKIADFGLSRAFATERDSHITTEPAGTLGYIDPEFRRSGILNKKSDVYSFGILLCELLTSQPAITRSREDNPHILQWVSPFIERGDIQSIVDPRLEGKFNTNCAWKLLDIALSCVRPTAIQRPDMSVVLVELKECLAMEMPSEMRTHNSIETNVLSTDMSLSPR